MSKHEAELIEAVMDLQKHIRSTFKFDVRKHFSLMVRDVAVSKAIEKALAHADPEATIPMVQS